RPSPVTLLIVAATPTLHPLSLHDALPISGISVSRVGGAAQIKAAVAGAGEEEIQQPLLRELLRARLDFLLPLLAHQRHPGLDQVDRKSTRLNSSHVEISYAVFCSKKENTT